MEEKNLSNESGVSVLHKKQVKELLDRLHQNETLSKEEYDRCISKENRVEQCQELLKILKLKDGGISALRTELGSLPPHVSDEKDATPSEDGATGMVFLNDPKIEEKHTKAVKEKDETISALRTENNQLREDLDKKTEELEVSKTESDQRPNDAADLQEQRAIAIMYNIDEERTGERMKAKGTLYEVLKTERKKIQQLEKDKLELRKEVTGLKETITLKDQAMMIVNELEDLYPYIKEVLGCPVHYIPMTNGDLRDITLYCLDMKFDTSHVNTQFCQVSGAGLLINSPPDVMNDNGYKKYQGTVGSIPIMLPIASSPLLPPALQYWESHTFVALDDWVLTFHTLLEIGVCEEGWVDKMSWVHKQPRSWSIRVGVCRTHRWGICTQVWGNQRQKGLCHTHAMSNSPNKSATLCHGVVVDVGKGRVTFLDLNKERILHTFSVQFKETLFPVFALEPQAPKCYLNMKLMCGSEIELTESKKHLIQKALCSD